MNVHVVIRAVTGLVGSFDRNQSSGFPAVTRLDAPHVMLQPLQYNIRFVGLQSMYQLSVNTLHFSVIFRSHDAVCILCKCCFDVSSALGNSPVNVVCMLDQKFRLLRVHFTCIWCSKVVPFAGACNTILMIRV